MNPIQDTKFVAITPPGAILDDTSATTAAVDTAGFNYATVVVLLGATDIALTALKLQHSDAAGSGYVDIDGADFNGDTDIEGGTAALPSGTDDNKFFVVEVDLRNKKRYLDLVATIGDGSSGAYFTAFAILSQSSLGLHTAADRGAASVLRV